MRTPDELVGWSARSLLSDLVAIQVGWRRIAQGTCDGATQDNRQPCICPAGLAQRRAAAKQGYGCRPCAEVRFRFRDNPAPEIFGFASEDWSFVELLTTTRAELSNGETKGSVRARLALRRSLHTLRSGRVLPYTHPVLALLGLPSVFAGQQCRGDQHTREKPKT
jgi:hypothetical protein